MWGCSSLSCLAHHSVPCRLHQWDRGSCDSSTTTSPSPQESYPAVPPIWSVESDDPNLAAILERLVEVRKGNTLVRERCLGRGEARGWLLREGKIPAACLQPRSTFGLVRVQEVRDEQLWLFLSLMLGCDFAPVSATAWSGKEWPLGPRWLVAALRMAEA